MDKGIAFCIRMKRNSWKEIREFQKSDETQKNVTFNFPKKDRAKLDKSSKLHDQPITCRLIKVMLDTGEEEILCTSLINTENYPEDQFKQGKRFYTFSTNSL